VRASTGGVYPTLNGWVAAKQPTTLSFSEGVFAIVVTLLVRAR
jgi:hypothetical protein